MLPLMVVGKSMTMQVPEVKASAQNTKSEDKEEGSDGARSPCRRLDSAREARSHGDFADEINRAFGVVDAKARRAKPIEAPRAKPLTEAQKRVAAFAEMTRALVREHKEAVVRRRLARLAPKPEIAYDYVVPDMRWPPLPHIPTLAPGSGPDEFKSPDQIL